MMKTLLFSFSLFFAFSNLFGQSQSCTPQGDETTYGTDNIWKGYVYDNKDLTGYKGYILEGSSSNPAFDEAFGGSDVYFPTHGCDVQTTTFSVRFKLTKTFTPGVYEFTVGGDDGYRLSLDGGSSWVIDKWVLQSYNITPYTTTLNGTYNLVLEYYENYADNRISFSINNSSCGVENTSEYGINNQWRGYLYDGTAFNTYKGMVYRGTSTDPSFTENFGGSNNQFATSGCHVQTETFSARYRLRKNFQPGDYTFIVGGDDGYRFSIDGGATWLINKWNYQSYNQSTQTVTLNGTYNLVLEYFEGGGDNYLTFVVESSIPLPIKLVSFKGWEENNHASLTWDVTAGSNPDHFEIEKSVDNSIFSPAGIVSGTTGMNNGSTINFTFTDPVPLADATQYRLKMTDKTNVVTYSRILLIHAATNSNALSSPVKVFPTMITADEFFIFPDTGMENCIVRVTDLSGRPLLTKLLGKLYPRQKITISIQGKSLQRGIYIVQVIDQNKAVTLQKIIIQ